MTKIIETENHVKTLVHDWYKARNAYNWAQVSNGMGVHGIPDRNGAVPVVVTQEMVGKTIGLFVAVESKRPGRRGEKNRGMSKHQVDRCQEINDASGIAVCCDGYDDLAELNRLISALTGAAFI